MARQKAIQLNQGLHEIASAQAISLANQANRSHKSMGSELQVHDALTFLVTAGLSIELFFKALMLAARNGLVTKGHALESLYNEFPDFLRNSLSEKYLSQSKDIALPIEIIAIIQSPTTPKVPDRMGLAKNYSTFGQAIESISNIFTRSRYFFEEINIKEYSYVDYPVGQIKAVIFALEATYKDYLAGRFNTEPA
ncbi:hypothetical protein ACJJIU_08785 [Microbulbifer sp. CnH-101-E]|uniref:hypothetical protein n=1 Tax=unclassified Microbulbifer TaxID=2619833 RepID=UPI0040398A74